MLELIFDYSSRDSALEIDDENGYIIQVRDEYMDIVEKLCPVDISNAVLKTLTVIRLKEPIRVVGKYQGLEIELNKATVEGGDRWIHIQNDKFRLILLRI